MYVSNNENIEQSYSYFSWVRTEQRSGLVSQCTSQLLWPHTYLPQPNMSGIAANAKVLVNSFIHLMKTNEVEQDKIDRMQPKIEEMVGDFTQWLDKVNKEISGQKELIAALIKRIAQLEKKVKVSVASERRRDFNLVRNNLIAKSQKTVTEVQKYIANMVEKGGGGKIVQKNIPVVELQQAPGKQRDFKIYRVVMAEGQKKCVFSGIAKSHAEGDPAHLVPRVPGVKIVPDIRLDNECPAYLVQTKRQMERISYSIRSKYHDSHKVKVKLAVKSQKMRIFVKDKDCPQWVGLDDIRAQIYMDTDVHFGAEELPADGIPKVRDFYANLLSALD